MTNISDDHVKVHFRMDMDEDGWPPASVESLWAVDLGDGTVRLDNTPWFVRGVAGDDIIRVEIDDEGIRWAGETVRASENCTIRLIVLKDDGSAAARQSGWCPTEWCNSDLRIAPGHGAAIAQLSE
ncbi:DUF4265 domain-containing protein [Streptomyces sp. NPDC049887]|uniref:DUF4265 domain-containing protein n=1 Tax=Streptomyces sp. NPDC049887 TaxID=3155654 RepID=UPI003427EC07